MSVLISLSNSLIWANISDKAEVCISTAVTRSGEVTINAWGESSGDCYWAVIMIVSRRVAGLAPVMDNIPAEPRLGSRPADRASENER